MARTRLLLAFGGASSEHEVSIRSATSVRAAIDPARYDVVPLGIRRDGSFVTGPADAELTAILTEGRAVADVRALSGELVFPVLHGPNGEDGTFQGFLEILGLPYVGSGVLASALCMDKVAQKQLVKTAAPEVPLVPWVDLHRDGVHDATVHDRIADALGFPCFVKPVNMGSSVGVVKVAQRDALPGALAEAARFDTRIVVEQGVDAREIEIAVLGNGGPETIASPPGEIVLPPGVWYDYETKYVNDVATLHIPAQLPDEVTATIATLAKKAFVATGCKGLARIDFLLERGTGTP
ncbi:MAG: D-alanine--D-alanine ligase family protein, partial [Myxococcota bacterium]